MVGLDGNTYLLQDGLRQPAEVRACAAVVVAADLAGRAGVAGH